jgi:hypothetical protein
MIVHVTHDHILPQTLLKTAAAAAAAGERGESFQLEWHSHTKSVTQIQTSSI